MSASGSVPQVDIIGVPFNSSGRADGVARAPQALREAGLVAALVDASVGVRDVGDLDLPPSTEERDAESHVIASGVIPPMVERVRRGVDASLNAGAFPLVLGGDCPILLGCLGATVPRGGPRVLFIDGHEDAWPPERSTTGEAADMELGWLLGATTDSLPPSLRRAIPRLQPEDVIVVGARDERELAEADVNSVDELVRIVRPDTILAAPEAVAADVVSALDARGAWWLHLDLDVLATASLAAVDYRQPGGLDWSTLTRLCSRAIASPGVLGLTVTIYNPDLDPDRSGATRIVRFLGELLGGLIAR